MEELGTVKAICRYPVKSIGGESLASAAMRWPGFDGDRQYAFYRAANGSRFPWLTGRELAELVTWSARYVEADSPRHSAVRVATGETEYEVGDPALCERLSRAAGEEVRLLQVGRGTFDSMPISVLSTATVGLVEARCGVAIDARRFRANILVASADGQAARETNWVGGTLVFGEAPEAPRLRVNAPIGRCVMITIDPGTAARDPAILRHVVEGFGNEIGAYCAVEAIGTVAVGDRVRLLQ
jgi:hypothetical protein